MRSKSNTALASRSRVWRRARSLRAGAQVQLQALQAAVQLAGLHRALHGLQQVLGHPGLEHVLVDAGLVDAGDDVLAVGVAGDDDAHHLGPALAHFLEELDAGLAGHALVAQHHGHLVARDQLAGDVGVAGGEHAEVLVQRAAHGLLRTQLVVHHQHQRQVITRVHRGGRGSGAFMAS
jgi:hypothetical protein